MLAWSARPLSAIKCDDSIEELNLALLDFLVFGIVRARLKSNSAMSDVTPPRRLRWYERILLGTGGLTLAVLLATAAWLTPNVRGMGTHQQLGLPQCTMVQLTGMRCPSCGMTTSWSYLMKGNLLGSAKANLAGCLMGLIALVISPWFLSSAVMGRMTIRVPSDAVLITITLLVVAVTLLDWLYRINV